MSHILFAPFARPLRNDGKNAKDYPWPHELAKLLDDCELVQVGTSNEEQICDRFEKDLPYAEVEQLLLKCDTFIGVDSYLQHHAWFVKKRGIVLWGQSDPAIFGHDLHINLFKNKSYFRQNQFDIWEACPVNDESFVRPEEVAEWVEGQFAPQEVAA